MAPAVMRAYTNREDLDFSTVAELPPMQQWDLQENLNGSIEYPHAVRCPLPPALPSHIAVDPPGSPERPDADTLYSGSSYVISPFSPLLCL